MRFFQPLLRSPHACRAVALAAAAPFAYEIRRKQLTEGESSDVLFPIADKQRVEKQWSMTSSSSTSNSSHHINKVKISTPGLTFVSVDKGSDDLSDQQQIGAIRVSADKSELLECIEVVPLQPNGIEIRFKKDTPVITGHLLTELSLRQEAQVNIVEASGGGVVVVEENVLVTDCAHADVKLSLKGHGELFIDASSTDIDLKNLLLSVAGSGKIQFGAAEIVVMDDVLLQVAGSGHANLFAKSKLHASVVKSSIVGAGHTTTASSDLLVNKLKSSIAGYGEAKHFGPGRADIQRVSITGSGNVTSKEIVSDVATVRVIGSGEAMLDVKEHLEATCKGWGVVRYVNTPPNIVKTSSLSVEKARAAVRKPTQEDKQNARSFPVPERKDAFDDISVEYDPKTAKEYQKDSFDVFGAIDALKSAISARRVQFSSESQSECEEDCEEREERRQEGNN